MKTVDKMILFNRFLRENKKHKFDLHNQLTLHQEYFNTQSKYWQDKDLYNSIDNTLVTIQDLNKLYSESIDKIDKNIEELLRAQEKLVIERDYITYEETERNLGLIIEQAQVPQEFI